MRLVATVQAKRLLSSALIFTVLAVLFLLGFALLRHDENAKTVFSTWNGNVYQTKSELLMEAMRYVGVCSPEAAASLWAEGLKQRSAALQYAAMSDMLKEEYQKRLQTTAPNWVTGVSSPWVDSYTIVSMKESGANSRVAELTFTLVSSGSPAQTYNASLLLAEQNGFWRVNGITMDEQLYPYTGF